ncbi:MAG: hypothetical protein ACLTSL_00370 [Odoribacter splanchnicus]
MKSLKIYLCCILLVSVWACCKEEDIIPGEPEANLFYPHSFSSKYAQICQDFYAETGCYLLLNDTLKHEYTGVDMYGNPVYKTELLDLTYGITSTRQWKFVFDYATDEERILKSLDIIKNELLASIDTVYYPYSFLLVETLKATAYRIEEGALVGSWSDLQEEDDYIGSRAIALSMSRLLMNPQGFMDKFLKKLLVEQLTTTILQDFYAFGNSCYGRSEIVGEFESEEDFLTQTGILFYSADWGEDEEGNTVLIIYDASYLDDRDCYLDAILEGKEAEFRKEYADYDVVIRKLELLKQAIANLGFKMN